MEISASSSAASSPLETSSRVADRIPSRTLTQDDFLKLVVAQMTTQDPMNPRKDTEFIAQMAQFSALEQSKSMQNEMAHLRADQLFLQANALLGRVVELHEPQGAGGLVTAIHVVEGMPKIVVDGEAYDLNQVVSVAPATTAAG